MRDKTLYGAEESLESEEAGEATFAEETGQQTGEDLAPDAVDSVETSAEPAEDETAQGYDEAVERRAPYGAEPEIIAQYSADPVAVTEAEPISEDELILLETGRDLRPDTVVPAPDITSTDAAVLERFREIANDEDLADRFAMNEEIASQESESQTSAPAVSEDAASSGSTDEEKQDASPDAAN
jgi:hypothetical protein